MTVRAFNATVGREGLCPIVLVFGVILSTARAIPSTTQLQRAQTIDTSITKVEREQSRRMIALGLRHTGGPKRSEQSTKLRNLPHGAAVMVYRTTTKPWEGPFRFVNMAGDTVVVQNRIGCSIFRTTCIRPERDSTFPPTTPDPTREIFAATSKKETAARDFAKSTKEELDGLVTNGTFIPTPRNYIPVHKRLFVSRFIDQLKR